MKLKKRFLLAAIYCSSFGMHSLYAQNINELISSGKYSDVIERYANHTDTLSTQSLFYVGVAYHYLKDYTKSIAIIDECIRKDSTVLSAYELKGNTLALLGQYEEALRCFAAGLEIDREDASLYTQMGIIHYQSNEIDKALESFDTALLMPDCPVDAYLYCGYIYTDLNKYPEALASFYKARDLAADDQDLYVHILFNIGLIHSLNREYQQAESNFRELLSLNPNDYHAQSKLIQIYYHNKEYEKAKPLKKILYDAYEKGILPENMADMFCIDQFPYGDYNIMVFERYESGDKDKIYFKTNFYMLDSKGDVVMRLQTEYSPYSKAITGTPYLLCGYKDNTHLNFGIGIEEDTPYEELKKFVIEILDNQVKPVASSTF